MRPVSQNALPVPDIDVVCDVFATNFVAAVGIPQRQ
jgi:hypothetical protein